MVMQANRKQLNRIFASWMLAGFWFLALVGVSAVTAPYDLSAIDQFAAETPAASEPLLVSAVMTLSDRPFR